jgi:hypothetical protein
VVGAGVSRLVRWIWELGIGSRAEDDGEQGQPGHAQAEDGIHGLSLGLAGLVPFCPYGISEVY